MNWDDLRILHHVAIRGSFLGAGQDLGMAASTVSRRISQLEASLSVSLLERGVDGCRLTAQGSGFAEIAKTVSGQLDRQVLMARRGCAALSGAITITSIEGFSEIITDTITVFAQQNPACSIDYHVTSDSLDVARGKVDIAIRNDNRGETSLIYRKIAEVGFGFFASRSYLDSFSGELTPEQVDYIDLLPPMDQVAHKRAAKEAGFTNARIRISSYNSHFQAVRRGFGIATLPRAMAAGELVEIFQEIPLPPMNVYVVTRPQALKQPHIRAFVDTLYAAFEEAAELLECTLKPAHR